MDFARGLVGVVLSLIFVAGIFAAGAFAPKEYGQSYVIEAVSDRDFCFVD